MPKTTTVQASTADRLRARTRPTDTLTFCDDETIRDDLARAKAEHAQAQAYGTEASKSAAAERLAAAQAAFDETAIVLTFQALPRTEFEDLKKEHPPTEEQAEDGQMINPNTLAPVLVSRSSLDGITLEDATTYLTDWSEGEAAALFVTAWNVQSHRRSDLGKG